jgi:hypothetical protein
MKHIRDVEQPEVGEIYLVPTVHGSPVIGTPHEDDFFGGTEVVPRHYHIDTRFLDAGSGVVVRANQTPRDSAWQCLHEDLDQWDGEDLGLVQMDVTMTYADSKAICGRCPHQGMPIINGVCSGHRMKFDGNTPRHRGPFVLQSMSNGAAWTVNSIFDLQALKVTVDGFYHYFQLLDCMGRAVTHFRLNGSGMDAVNGDILYINKDYSRNKLTNHKTVV